MSISVLRRFSPWLIIGFYCATHVYAQLEVRLGVGRDNFVQHEPIHVDTFIISNHNKAIILGDKEGWIRFSVRDGRGFPVNQAGHPPRGNLFVLSSGKR